MNGKYMAYVGSYSYTGKAKGITVYDVDVENGVFKERCEMEVDNSSYVIASSDGKTLYSIADEGGIVPHPAERKPGQVKQFTYTRHEGLPSVHRHGG